MSQTGRGERLQTPELVRGFAALSVMWIHFAFLLVGEDHAGLRAWIIASARYGWLGVQIFFVTSGFILPYSMYRSRYSLEHCGTFLKKRILRLDPPYLVAIVIALCVECASNIYKHETVVLDMPRLLLHLGYLNVFAGYEWYNAVFWTLAIEFQFYLLIALLFPILVHRCRIVRTAFPSLLAVGAWILLHAGDRQFVFPWLGLFALGMVAFQFRASLISTRCSLLQLLVITAINVQGLGIRLSLVGLCPALLFAFANPPRIAPLAFFGTISYSLYLVHVPIGTSLICLGNRYFETLPPQLAVMAVTIAASVASAYLMYRWVERPAQSWSSSVSYRTTGPANSRSIAATIADSPVLPSHSSATSG